MYLRSDRLLGGDVDTGKAMLRDYINATTGFEESVADHSGWQEA